MDLPVLARANTGRPRGVNRSLGSVQLRSASTVPVGLTPVPGRFKAQDYPHPMIRQFREPSTVDARRVLRTASLSISNEPVIEISVGVTGEQIRSKSPRWCSQDSAVGKPNYSFELARMELLMAERVLKLRLRSDFLPRRVWVRSCDPMKWMESWHRASNCFTSRCVFLLFHGQFCRWHDLIAMGLEVSAPIRSLFPAPKVERRNWLGKCLNGSNLV